MPCPVTSLEPCAFNACPPLQMLSVSTLLVAFMVSTMSYVVSGGDGQVAWAGVLLLSFVAFERVSGSSESERYPFAAISSIH